MLPDAAVVFGPQHEPSAWLRGVYAARLAELAELAELAGAELGPWDVALAPLSGRPTAPDTPEDRQCDRCGVFVPVGDVLHILVARPRPNVCLVGALCADCSRREVAS